MNAVALPVLALSALLLPPASRSVRGVGGAGGGGGAAGVVGVALLLCPHFVH